MFLLYKNSCPLGEMPHGEAVGVTIKQGILWSDLKNLRMINAVFR